MLNIFALVGFLTINVERIKHIRVALSENLNAELIFDEKTTL